MLPQKHFLTNTILLLVLSTISFYTKAQDSLLYGFSEPYQRKPLPEDDSYTSESLYSLDSIETLNYKDGKLKYAEISGNHIIISKGFENKIYERYNGLTNIKILRIFAEKLTIGSPFLLPQTNVEIYTNELEFSDSLACISTVPENKSNLQPPQFDSGVGGLIAGGITLWVTNLPIDSKHIRFILRGGDGQPGGAGKAAVAGDSMDIIPTVWKGNKLCPDACIGMCQGNDIVSHAVYLVNKISQCKRGEDKWPGDGLDAIPGGAPGEGGKGGVLISNVNLKQQSDIKGGISGKKAENLLSESKPGGPNPAYWLIYQVKKTGGGEYTYKEHEQKTGKGVFSPSAKKSIGDSGKIICDVSKSMAWLRENNAKMVTQYAEDLYYTRYTDDALKIFSRYAIAIKSIFVDTSQTTANELELKNLKLVLDRIERNRLQLANGLDYFGNPNNWAPILSLEAYKGAFEEEIKSSIKTFYLAYWLINAMDTASNKSKILSDAIEDARISIDQTLLEYNQIVSKEIPLLQNDIDEITLEQRYLLTQAKIREQALADSATDIIEERQRKAKERQAWRIFGAIVSVVPVAQPVAGLLGTTIKSLAAEEGPNFWNTADALVKAWPGINKYKSNLDKVRNSSKPLDYSSAEKLKESKEKSEKDFKDGLGNIIPTVAESFLEATKSKVPAADVEKELAALEITDTNFIRLRNRLIQLNKIKEETGERLTILLQSMSQKLETIQKFENIIEVCTNEFFTIFKGFDQKSKIAILDLRQNSLDRLRYYHYKFTKAYEFRLLEPYKHTLLLENIYKKFEELARANKLQLSENDVSAMVNIYEDQLREVAKDIMESFDKLKEKTLKRTIRISQEEMINKLNEGGVIEINLSNFPEFVDRGESNLRIISITAIPEKISGMDGTIDIELQHSGISTFRNGDKKYIFRQLGNDEKSNISWKSTYDIASHEVNEAKTSDDSESLLRSFMPSGSDRIALFSRPGLDAIVKIRLYTYPSDIKIKQIKLKVKYSFSKE